MKDVKQTGVLLMNSADSSASPSRLAVTFALGFRPFFLGAGVLAAVWVPLWLFIYRGSVQLPLPAPGTLWHAHEMVFGFAIAVIAGFLLTAVRNWTGKPVPTGLGLAGLFLLWCAGRAVMLYGGALPTWLVTTVDLAFLPVLAVSLAVPLVKAANKRNYALLGLLSLMFLANAAFHFAGDYVAQLRALNITIIGVLAIIHIVGGRIVPNFTQNAMRQLKVTRNVKADWASFVFLLALIPLEAVLGSDSKITAVTALTAGVLNFWRMWGWQSLATRRSPILWILHIGYFWLPLGLLLLGISGFTEAVSHSAAMHVLTIGAISTLILGMMSRVSLGHTGRPLVVRSIITAAFYLLIAAVFLRVVPALLVGSWYWFGLVAAGVLWSLSFLLFLVVYTPILTTPRADGKPG